MSWTAGLFVHPVVLARSTARLVERLWPDEQSEHPTKALQVLVSRARAQLGAHVIATTPIGYRR